MTDTRNKLDEVVSRRPLEERTWKHIAPDLVRLVDELRRESRVSGMEVAVEEIVRLRSLVEELKSSSQNEYEPLPHWAAQAIKEQYK